MSSPNNPPVKIFRIGLLSANIWQRESGGRQFQAVTFRRAYRDSQNQWCDTDSFNLADLPGLARLADLSCDYLIGLDESIRKDSPVTEEAST